MCLVVTGSWRRFVYFGLRRNIFIFFWFVFGFIRFKFVGTRMRINKGGRFCDDDKDKNISFVFSVVCGCGA